MVARVSIVLYDYKLKANGKYPVKLRIIFNRQHKDYALGIDLTKTEFTEVNKKIPPKHLRNTSTKLQGIEAKARLIVEGLTGFTFQKFEAAFRGQSKDASDIFPFFDEYIDQLVKENRIKTATSYRTAKNSIKSFLGKKQLALLDITPQFLRNYQERLIQEGKSISTIGIYIRALRVIYNYCISKGFIKKDENYPFGRGRYIIPAGRNIKKALSINEIKKIHDYVTEPGSYQDRAKDMWLLSYYTNGMNFKDLALLKFKNIDGDMIRFVRAKTKRTGQGNQKIISCHISDKAKEIIQKWSKEDTKNGESYLLNILDEGDSPEIIEKKVGQFIQNTNKNMAKICKAVGIDKKVTTYYSRHSAATILKRSGATTVQIQEALGHESLLTTEKYLDSLGDEVKKELANALTNF